MKRIDGGQLSRKAKATLLSSHAGGPRMAAGDTSFTGQAKAVNTALESQPAASPRTYRSGRTSPPRQPTVTALRPPLARDDELGYLRKPGSARTTCPRRPIERRQHGHATAAARSSLQHHGAEDVGAGRRASADRPLSFHSLERALRPELAPQPTEGLSVGAAARRLKVRLGEKRISRLTQRRRALPRRAQPPVRTPAGARLQGMCYLHCVCPGSIDEL